jgi:hypothetical protein
MDLGVVHVCHTSDRDIAGFRDKPVLSQWQLIKMPTAPLFKLTLTILDYTTGNPQTQSFSYDSLNRMVSASATNGASGHGDHSESYTYNATTGNLASKAGVSYGYNDGAHAHAVTHLGGVQKYWYICHREQLA